MKYLYIFLFIILNCYFSIDSNACTVFHDTDQEDRVFVGRNFDWDSSGGNIWFIPGDKNNNSITIFEQNGADMPYEGVNNKGLFIAVTAVPDTQTPLSIFKPMRKSLEMIGIVLKQADDVESALKIFPKYTIIFGKFLGYPLIHYKIVDAKGNSAIIEYVHGKLKVIKDDNCQVMTNHYNSNTNIKSDSKTSFKRYNIAKNALKLRKNSPEDIKSILRDTSQKSTIWSNLYDLTNNKLYTSYKNSNYIAINLEKEMYLGVHGYNLEKLKNKKILKYTEKTSLLKIRPHFGYSSSASHYGGRILLAADNVHSYGLEFTQFNYSSNSFSSLGIVLEQKLFGWFNSSIGTVGYFNYGQNNNNLIGLTSNLGWEPDNSIPFKPFITYRQDIIFDKKTEVIHSISFGFTFDF